MQSSWSLGVFCSGFLRSAVWKMWGQISRLCPSLREPQQDSKLSILPAGGFRYFFCISAPAIALPGRPDLELAMVDFFLSPPFPAVCTSLAAQDLSPVLHKLLLCCGGNPTYAKLQLDNQNLPVQFKNKQSYLIFCMYVFPVYSLDLPWHFYSSRRLLSCQQWSIALTLSLNYTITLLCTVVRAIKHLKYFKQI